jgi:Mg-chelatase subunit ChlD
MKRLDLTKSFQVVVLLLSFTHSRVDARQHWFSGPVTDPSYPEPGSLVQTGSLRSLQTVSPRFFDFTVSLYSNPQGDNDGSTQWKNVASTDQDAYEEIFQYMADGIYEATEGAHKLRKVRIFRNSAMSRTSNIVWKEEGRARASINGIATVGLHIYMYDVLNGDNRLKEDRIGAGFALAHEYGHYALGLYDEYDIDGDGYDDEPVKPSIMNAQFKARDKTTQTLINTDWLQYSIKRTTGGNFQNTLKTKQHRKYGASGWETLSQSKTAAEQVNKYGSSSVRRVVYPELAVVAPTGTNTPKSPDSGNARSDLEIIWQEEKLVYEIVIDNSGSMGNEEGKIESARAAARLLVDLAEINSAIGVIRFDSYPVVVTPITIISDQATKATIKAAINTIEPGDYTYIGEAAKFALNQLQSPGTPDGIKVVFLLTDGTSNDNALAPIPEYQAAQVPIFAFSYGKDADTETLRAMAEQTKGQLYISPVSLAAISQAIQDANTFAASASDVTAGQRTVQAGETSISTVIVDSTLVRLNVIVTFPGKRESATVNLITPDSKRLVPNDITQSSGETLEYFTIENPPTGTWQIAVTGNAAAPVTFDYQVTGLPQGETLALEVDAWDGKRKVNYPEPFVLRAALGLGLPVLNANVEAILTAPDGTSFTVTMNDAGTAPDSVANDGLYSAAVNYKQSGIYDVLVRVLAEAGVAVESEASLEPSAGENGEFIPFGPDSPLTETFERFERIQMNVSGVVQDDHGNTFADATTLPADNSLVPGIIDIAGDVDMFAIPAPAGSGEIAIRVSNLALGMDPLLSVFDGAKVLIQKRTLTDTQAQGGYVVVTVPYSGGETFYAKVSHQLPSGTGWYQVSAGSVLYKDLPPDEDPLPPDECADYNGYVALICYILQFLQELFDIFFGSNE